MQTNGHSFIKSRESISLGKVTVWHEVDKQYPGGAFVPCDATNVKGSVIKAGTPVKIAKYGAAPVLNSTDPTGVVRHDAVVGEQGCQIDIVTHGALYEDRVEVTYTDAVKTKLKNIIFIKEV